MLFIADVYLFLTNCCTVSERHPHGDVPSKAVRVSVPVGAGFERYSPAVAVGVAGCTVAGPDAVRVDGQALGVLAVLAIIVRGRRSLVCGGTPTALDMPARPSST